jgi:hypothetical protein
MRVSAWRRASIQSAALLISFGCFLAGGGGCNSNNAGPTDDMTMPGDKLKAITDADAVISTGETEIKEGQDMQAKDPDRSAKLIKQGEDDKARGESMKQQAIMMK